MCAHPCSCRSRRYDRWGLSKSTARRSTLRHHHRHVHRAPLASRTPSAVRPFGGRCPMATLRQAPDTRAKQPLRRCDVDHAFDGIRDRRPGDVRAAPTAGADVDAGPAGSPTCVGGLKSGPEDVVVQSRFPSACRVKLRACSRSGDPRSDLAGRTAAGLVGNGWVGDSCLSRHSRLAELARSSIGQIGSPVSRLRAYDVGLLVASARPRESSAPSTVTSIRIGAVGVS